MSLKTLTSAAGAAALCAVALHAQSTGTCTIAGTVAAGSRPLPGVVLSVVRPDAAAGDVVGVTSSSADGSYSLSLGSGSYILRAELTAFAPVMRPVAIDAANCPSRLDIPLTLASRAAATPEQTAGAGAPAAPPTGPAGAGRGAGGGRGGPGGRGQGGRAAGGQPTFQSLELVADQSGLARGDDTTEAAGAPGFLPAGFSPDTAAETIVAVGEAQPTSAFGPGGPGAFFDQFGGQGGFGGGPGGAGGPGGFGAPGGPGGRGFGPGEGFGGGGFLGRGGANQIRGNFSHSINSSALDTAPYALNGAPSTKPEYLQQRFTATIGGPLVIPKLVDSPRTFFFLNYTGNHSRNPFDSLITVPTTAERAGDLSALGRPVINPATGLPFAGNQIPSAQLDPAVQQLLARFPLPNLPGTTQNLRTVDTTTASVDDVNLRLQRSFGAQTQTPGQRGGRGGFGGGGGGRGGGGARGGTSNLSVTVHFRRSDTTSANPFPSLGGTNRLTAWDIPVTYSFSNLGLLHTVRGGFNRQQTNAQNRDAFLQNVATSAGIAGVSTDPFDWGMPGLSFSSLSSVRDVVPSTRVDQTVSFGDSVVKTIRTHSLRVGGDYRELRVDSRTDANARGAFVFTGLYTGSDLGDFLLGLPQQASVQYGPGTERFRSRSWDLFVQDDWRVSSAFTVNAGLRYEYYAPYREASNRLAMIDVSPSFTSAATVPVSAGGTGLFAGTLSDALVNPSRLGFAPRTGIAWRASNTLVVRAGYGINYNASVYQSIAQQLSAQPPFATTGTVIGSAATQVPIESVLLKAATASSSTYGVDPNFRLPFVQLWNASVRRDLTRTLTVEATYTGSKGVNLDVVRAPNRNPDGSLRISGVLPFLWESSEGSSTLNSLAVRVGKRTTAGFGVNATYTLSKATDDASSIAGGAVIVAQNDQNLGAEWGPSSFDQRHRLATAVNYELPFGADKRWLTTGAAAALLGNWQLTTNMNFASGTPLTARVLASARDVATGVNGSLRADYNGQTIGLGSPTEQLFFNTSAFAVPTAGTFGTAGRNTIVGPGTSVVNVGVQRTIPTGPNRALTIQLQANNVFNTVQFAAIDTAVNSPTFGRVTSARPMRTLQIVTRFRF